MCQRSKIYYAARKYLLTKHWSSNVSFPWGFHRTCGLSGGNLCHAQSSGLFSRFDGEGLLNSVPPYPILRVTEFATRKSPIAGARGPPPATYKRISYELGVVYRQLALTTHASDRRRSTLEGDWAQICSIAGTVKQASLRVLRRCSMILSGVAWTGSICGLLTTGG